MIEHGIPEYIRSDNGPEFVAKQLRKWLVRIGAKTLYIEPGSRWEKGGSKQRFPLPTPPTAISRCATLTISLVQITGQATRALSEKLAAAQPSPLIINLRVIPFTYRIIICYFINTG